MKIDDKDVDRVAELASLELSKAERVRIAHDLNSILHHIDVLSELDTENVEAMAQVSPGGRNTAERSLDALREDIVEGLRKSLPHEAAISNAPETDGVFFKVPKVIER